MVEILLIAVICWAVITLITGLTRPFPKKNTTEFPPVWTKILKERLDKGHE